uniref:Inactive rhomboid protein 2 n=1 Tax=Plectus sambesii TaxID=2011161 RepID=A0A914VWG9_9BILA
MRRSAINEHPPSTAPIHTDPLGVHHTFPMPRATLAKSYSTPAEDVIEMESVNSTRQRMRNPRKPPARTLSRAQSIRETLSSGAASFFGVPPKPTVSVAADPVELERDIKWKARRLRHMSRRYGAVREPSLDQQVAAGPLEDLMDSAVQPQTPIRDPLSIRRFLSSHQPSVDTAAVIGIDRSASTDSRGSKIRVLQRRDSVAKMAWDGLSTLVVKGSLKPKKPHVTSTIRRRRAQSRSFSPGSFIQSGDDSVFDSYSNMGSGSAMEPSFGDVFSPSSAGSTAKGSASHAYPESTMATIQEEPLGPRTSDRFSSDAHDSEGHICQGDRTPPFVDEEDAIDGHRMSASVAARTTSTDGLRRTDMLSQVPSLVSQDTSIHDDVFFDLTPQVAAVIQPMAPSPKVRTAARAPIQKMYSEGGAVPSMAPFAGSHHRHVHRIPHQGHRHHRQPPTAAQHPQARPSNLPGVRPFEYPPVIKHRQHLEPQEPVPTIRFAEDEPGVAYGQPGAYQRVAPDRPRIPPGLKTAQERKVRGVRRLKRQKKVELDERQRRHLVDNEPWTISNFLSKVAGNSDRRRYGEGALGKFFGRTLKRKSELSPHVVQQLTDSDDHRPYFTYWVTTVQILVTIIALAIYGFGPFGFGMEEKTANVLHSTVTLKQVAVYEQQNFWFGPKFSDLVHLGAKFSPCMRHDLKLYRQIEADRVVENTTGCCIYEDQTGCFQASADNCPKLIATHMKWTPSLPGPEGRISGAVCGQDPRSCEEPPSVDPFMWPDDITKWPICTKQPAQVSELRQMRCEITGRPCCIELHGQCRITTREYCDFVDGYFHEEATLCSQVLIAAVAGSRVVN